MILFIPCCGRLERHSFDGGTEQALTPQKFSFGQASLPQDAQKLTKDDIEGRSLVIPCFSIQPKRVGCLERSDLLTVTTAGAPYGV